jgi:hypothetical protein
MTSGDAQSASLFRIEGEYWTIAFDGRVCRLRDTKGLRYLALLLAHPATRVAAIDLIAAARSRLPEEQNGRQDGAPGEGGNRSIRERARVTVTKGIKSALQRIGGANPMLAQHLEVTIKRGYMCSYNPDPRVRIHWKT